MISLEMAKMKAFGLNKTTKTRWFLGKKRKKKQKLLLFFSNRQRKRTMLDKSLDKSQQNTKQRNKKI